MNVHISELEPRLLTRDQVCRKAGVTPGTFRNYVSMGLACSASRRGLGRGNGSECGWPVETVDQVKRTKEAIRRGFPLREQVRRLSPEVIKQRRTWWHRGVPTTTIDFEELVSKLAHPLAHFDKRFLRQIVRWALLLDLARGLRLDTATRIVTCYETDEALDPFVQDLLRCTGGTSKTSIRDAIARLAAACKLRDISKALADTRDDLRLSGRAERGALEAGTRSLEGLHEELTTFIESRGVAE